LLPTGTFKTQW